MPNAAGIDPVRALPLRFRYLRESRLPNSAGIGPVRELLVRFRYLSLVKSPNAAGIDPVRELLKSARESTRPSLSVPTPCHSLRGALLFQLLSMLQLAPLVES